MSLRWIYDYEGRWEACSEKDGDNAWFYRIGVCDDGTFDASESDVELIGHRQPETFPTLETAKDWCAAKEVIATFPKRFENEVG